jgi:CHRD domain
MTPSRTLASSVLLASLVALSACNMSPMASNVSTLTARLSGANEVPAASSNGSGTLSANLDKTTSVLTWTVTYSGLSGPATAGHFHGPAPMGQNAGVALPFTGSLESPIRGTATLSPAQMDAVMNGNWYVNLHTAANPGGEIRGQVALYP